ncbi:MAG TPA: LysM peptidoglycan-binding domain-containing protein, partial [Candidatus Absconditabacterales bacterium]|nr:LysM peptidoglycan-binding domain-containing protein [Candidatus Absconditabacterales bacterium]
MPFTKAQRNFTKITFALVILFVFGYIIIYADQFKYEESYIAINQNFVDTDSKDINSIDLNDVTIDEDIPGTLTYIVKNGDTLGSVALKFGTTVSNLKKVNQLQGRSIRVGMKLKITEEEGIIYQLPTDTNLLVFANQYNLN